jgi:hypothetical protein
MGACHEPAIGRTDESMSRNDAAERAEDAKAESHEGSASSSTDDAASEGAKDAAPDVLAPETKPRTACGKDGKTCDSESEICVGYEAWTTGFECKKLPLGCESKRSCDCNPLALCLEGGGVCIDTAPNTVVCVCVTC